MTSHWSHVLPKIYMSALAASIGSHWFIVQCLLVNQYSLYGGSVNSRYCVLLF